MTQTELGTELDLSNDATNVARNNEALAAQEERQQLRDALTGTTCPVKPHKHFAIAPQGIDVAVWIHPHEEIIASITLKNVASTTTFNCKFVGWSATEAKIHKYSDDNYSDVDSMAFAHWVNFNIYNERYAPFEDVTWKYVGLRAYSSPLYTDKADMFCHNHSQILANTCALLTWDTERPQDYNSAFPQVLDIHSGNKVYSVILAPNEASAKNPKAPAYKSQSWKEYQFRPTTL